MKEHWNVVKSNLNEILFELHWTKHTKKIRLKHIENENTKNRKIVRSITTYSAYKINRQQVFYEISCHIILCVPIYDWNKTKIKMKQKIYKIKF